MKRMTGALGGVLAGLVIVASTFVPAGPASAADLAFPILFVPIYSQNEPVNGGFSDTRITIFNPSQHCGPFEVLLALCMPPSPVALPVGTVFDVRLFFFNADEVLLATPSITMTPFDVEVVTGPTIPDGTGSAFMVNLLGGSAIPILAILHPLAAVVEIGAKLAPVNFNDPVAGPPAGPPPYLFAVVATEAQIIPAFAGEFARVEVTATELFGAGFETLIVETCVLAGIVNNYILNDEEHKLYDNHIPCTGLDTPGGGPDLLVWTPDDGGVLGTGVSAPGIGVIPDGYNRLAVDVDTSGLIYGQAIVVLPGAETRQAYSYNMAADFFLGFFQTPTTQAANFESLSTELNSSIKDSICAMLTYAAQFTGNVHTETGEDICNHQE